MVTQDQLLDLLRQLEAQQAEIKQLENRLEVQTHEMEKLKSRQRDLFNDLDRRLQLMEKRGAAEVDPARPAPERTPGAQLQTPPNAAEQSDYDAAFALLKQSQYERAIKGFREFIARYPQSALADNAQYWIAEGNYVLHDFKTALAEFNKLVQAYPSSSKMPDALLKIGYIHAEQNQDDKARSIFAELVRKYPQSAAAKLAEKRLQADKKPAR